jgi:hypothetical protein
VAERLERVRSRLESGPAAPFECVPALVGTDEPSPVLLNWGLVEALGYLTNLERRGVVRRVDGESLGSWELV